MIYSNTLIYHHNARNRYIKIPNKSKRKHLKLDVIYENDIIYNDYPKYNSYNQIDLCTKIKDLYHQVILFFKNHFS